MKIVRRVDKDGEEVGRLSRGWGGLPVFRGGEDEGWAREAEREQENHERVALSWERNRDGRGQLWLRKCPGIGQPESLSGLRECLWWLPN